MDDLKKLIREVMDYPKPGILFYDLTTLLKDKIGFHMLIDRLCDHYKGHTIDVVAGIEARGFIFAPALAYRLGAGFVPVRKPKNCRPKPRAFPMPSNMAPTRWRFTKTRSNRGRACLFATIFWPQAAQPPPPQSLSTNSAEKSKARRLRWN